MLSTLLYLSAAFVALIRLTVKAALPSPIYGVNLGSWLLLEPWMLPQEWLDMGGEICSDCSSCIATEFAFSQAFPDTVDRKFNDHWNSWFNQKDVNDLVKAGINTVRIPLGYWIVEDLVDRSTEFYPRGGLKQLRRGLRQLQNANIVVILDHHALPGVSAANQMFAGRCTSDVEFYTPHNYHRALIWTAVMTALSHIDPDFAAVMAIEAINEPIMDANQTPGYGDFQNNFVQVIRAMESSLGIGRGGASIGLSLFGMNFTAAVRTASSPNDEVDSAMQDALPIVTKILDQFNLDSETKNTEPLVTTFMDINWQHNNPSNPADAQDGPQVYDNHLYYSFGGVADPNPEAYLISICNLDRVQQDADLDNSPLLFGEWALSTQFQADDDFLTKWADAQKLAYEQGDGWIFWNFKVEISDRAGDLARQWSYLEGLRRGYLTKDPSKFNDPNVCDPYRN